MFKGQVGVYTTERWEYRCDICGELQLIYFNIIVAIVPAPELHCHQAVRTDIYERYIHT